MYYIVQSLTILYHCIFYATKKIVYFIANKIHPVYENRQIENNLLYSGQICVDGFFDIIYTKNPVISFLLFNSIVYYYFLITEFTIFDVRILFFLVTIFLLFLLMFSKKYRFSFRLLIIICRLAIVTHYIMMGLHFLFEKYFLGSILTDSFIYNGKYTVVYNIFEVAIWVVSLNLLFFLCH